MCINLYYEPYLKSFFETIIIIGVFKLKIVNYLTITTINNPLFNYAPQGKPVRDKSLKGFFP